MLSFQQDVPSAAQYTKLMQKKGGQSASRKEALDYADLCQSSRVISVYDKDQLVGVGTLKAPCGPQTGGISFLIAATHEGRRVEEHLCKLLQLQATAG